MLGLLFNFSVDQLIGVVQKECTNLFAGATALPLSTSYTAIMPISR
jgi:hypothetical protein